MGETTRPAGRITLKTLFYRKNGYRWFWLSGLSLLSLSMIYARRETDYRLQANIIYRFTKYVDWPSNKKNGDFIIGIVGDSPIYDELKALCANKSVSNRKIVVMKMSPSANSYNCHMLFISDEESGSLRKIDKLTAGEPILIISESEGLAHKGSCINFITVDERLKLEINKGNVEERGLNIASELLELAIIIK